MDIAIICSKKDPAGMNIRERLLALFPFKKTSEIHDGNPVYAFSPTLKLYTVEEPSVFQENLDGKIKADLFVFATKHESANKVHSLTVHSVGNFGEAVHGGTSGQLGIWPANIMKAAYLELKHQAHNLGIDSGFEITFEVTHHGPFMRKPLFFIEIGSDLSQFTRTDAGEVIARSVMAVLQKKIPAEKAVVGIGGLHYCHNLIRIVDKTKFCLGHVCPKYALENLDGELLKQMIERTDAEVECVVLDWKGLGGHKARITTLLDELKLPYKKLHDFIEDKTVP